MLLNIAQAVGNILLYFDAKIKDYQMVGQWYGPEHMGGGAGVHYMWNTEEKVGGDQIGQAICFTLTPPPIYTHHSHTLLTHITHTHRLHTSPTYIHHTHYPHTSPKHITHTHSPHTSPTHITHSHTHYPHILPTHITRTHHPHTTFTHIPHTHHPHSITTISTILYYTSVAPVVYWIFLRNYFR